MQLQTYLYIFLASISFGVVFNIQGRKLFFAGLGGVISWWAYVIMGPILSSETARYFAATIVLAVYSEMLARLFKAPVTIFMVIAIIPLVPGNSIYLSMESFVAGNTEKFNQVTLSTISIAGAIAMGLVLTSSTITMYYNWRRRVSKATNLSIGGQ